MTRAIRPRELAGHGGATRALRPAARAATPVATRAPAPRLSYRGGGKRLLDLALVLATLVLTVPLIALLALAVRRDGGPAFFAHARVGRDGRTFRCWKLRSMVPDAERRLAEHLARDPAARREWAASRKLSHDPRITPLGRVLRRLSLDELPQLWNVLAGDMSLVGPRPVPRDELMLYGGAARHYRALRPGLTGLWQVSGRNALRYSQRVALDVSYARRHGLMLDLWLILATLGTMARMTGR